LQTLYLSDNPGIQSIQNGNLFNKLLFWPSLTQLHLSRCPNLKSLWIEAPALIDFRNEDCPQLDNKQVITVAVADDTADGTAIPVNQWLRETRFIKFSANVPQFKTVVLGSTKYKTVAFCRYIKGSESYTPHQPVIGADFCTKLIKIQQQEFKVELLDMSEQGHYFEKLLPQPITRGALLILIFARLSSHRECQDDIKTWWPQLDPEQSVVVIGIKESCADKSISSDEAKIMAKQQGAEGYFECCNLEESWPGKFSGVEEAFQGAFEIAVARSGYQPNSTEDTSLHHALGHPTAYNL
jgi:Ras family